MLKTKLRSLVLRENLIATNSKRFISRDVLLKQIEEQAYEFGWSERNFVDALNENYIAKALINYSVVVGYYFWQKVLDECHLLNFTIASERQRRPKQWILSQLLVSLRTKGITAIYLEVRPAMTQRYHYIQDLVFQ